MLDYYTAYGISPVHQDIQDLARHLQRRRSLYLSIGISGATLRGSDILEVGPGSGHNSLFVASQLPQTYTLLEPNPTAAKDIEKLYDGFVLPHVRPVTIQQKLEDFTARDSFDVVICEGWLGSAPHELGLLTKLCQMVRPGGVLVTTEFCPLGLTFNTLRKALCLKISPPRLDPWERLLTVTPAFSAHLSTLADMTRPHSDWMLDMVLSPAFFDICLTPELASDAIGLEFDVMGCQPRFIEDWRWYKSLYGQDGALSLAYHKSYRANCLNFMDYQHNFGPQPEEIITPLLSAASQLLAETARWERNYADIGPLCPSAILNAGEELALHLSSVAPDLAMGVREATGALRAEQLSAETIAALPNFAPLFGREMIYVARCRNEDRL